MVRQQNRRICLIVRNTNRWSVITTAHLFVAWGVASAKPNSFEFIARPTLRPRPIPRSHITKERRYPARVGYQKSIFQFDGNAVLAFAARDSTPESVTCG
jgi:hypothetical protein